MSVMWCLISKTGQCSCGCGVDQCHGLRLLSGSVYQASLLRMRENQQPIKCKLHSSKWRKYHVQLLTVTLLKMF